MSNENKVRLFFYIDNSKNNPLGGSPLSQLKYIHGSGGATKTYKDSFHDLVGYLNSPRIVSYPGSLFSKSGTVDGNSYTLCDADDIPKMIYDNNLLKLVYENNGVKTDLDKLSFKYETAGAFQLLFNIASIVYFYPSIVTTSASVNTYSNKIDEIIRNNNDGFRVLLSDPYINILTKYISKSFTYTKDTNNNIIDHFTIKLQTNLKEESSNTTHDIEVEYTVYINSDMFSEFAKNSNLKVYRYEDLGDPSNLNLPSGTDVRHIISENEFDQQIIDSLFNKLKDENYKSYRKSTYKYRSQGDGVVTDSSGKAVGTDTDFFIFTYYTDSDASAVPKKPSDVDIKEAIQSYLKSYDTDQLAKDSSYVAKANNGYWPTLFNKSEIFLMPNYVINRHTVTLHELTDFKEKQIDSKYTDQNDGGTTSVIPTSYIDIFYFDDLSNADKTVVDLPQIPVFAFERNKETRPSDPKGPIQELFGTQYEPKIDTSKLSGDTPSEFQWLVASLISLLITESYNIDTAKLQGKFTSADINKYSISIVNNTIQFAFKNISFKVIYEYAKN